MRKIKQVEHDLSDQLVRDLLNFALIGMPYEVCGIIHSHNIIHQLPNTFAGDKRNGFDMTVPAGTDVKYVWHSHPSGLTMPSRDDTPMMELLAKNGHPYPWLIITSSSVSAWSFDSSYLLANS